MTPAASALPSPTQLVCERCGSFASQLEAVGTRKVCAPCLTRAAAEGRYWSATYLTALGALLNVVPSLVLLALNHRRLGDAKQARSWAIGAAVAGVITVAFVLFNLPIPAGAWIGANVGTAFTIGRTWKPAWSRLEALGAKPANRWLPPLLTVVVLAAMIAASGLLFGIEP